MPLGEVLFILIGHQAEASFARSVKASHGGLLLRWMLRQRVSNNPDPSYFDKQQSVTKRRPDLLGGIWGDQIDQVEAPRSKVSREKVEK